MPLIASMFSSRLGKLKQVYTWCYDETVRVFNIVGGVGGGVGLVLVECRATLCFGCL